MIDEKFGRLLVLSYAGVDKNKNKKWLCECDCGNKKEILEYSLLSNNTKSCGCLRKEKSKNRRLIDLTGKKFGYLTVIGKSKKKTKCTSIYWECLCDCGNEKAVNGQHLRNGVTKSCGCYNKEKGRYLYLHKSK